MENLGLFGKLPGELRNTIYELSLTHDTWKNCKASPALLRTCKQIHTEAKPILYHESRFGLDLDADHDSFTVMADVEGEYSFNGEYYMPTLPKLSSINPLFPRWALRVRQWSIVVHSQQDDEEPLIVNDFLYRMASFLNDGTCAVEHVRITVRQFEGRREEDHAWGMDVLYPILKMRQVVLCPHFEGFEDNVRDSMKRLYFSKNREVRAVIRRDMRRNVAAVRNGDDWPLLEGILSKAQENGSGKLVYLVQLIWKNLDEHFGPSSGTKFGKVINYECDKGAGIQMGVLREILTVLRSDADDEEQERYFEYLKTPSRDEYVPYDACEIMFALARHGTSGE